MFYLLQDGYAHIYIYVYMHTSYRASYVLALVHCFPTGLVRDLSVFKGLGTMGTDLLKAMCNAVNMAL